MKRKIIGLLLFIFIIIISTNVFGTTIGVGEEYTYTFSDLTENGNVPTKITGASSGNDIVSVTEEETGIWPFKAISGIKIKGLKAGTTSITISAERDITTTDMYGQITTMKQPISKTFDITVRDYVAEAEQAKQEADNAYQTEPAENADAKTIKNFVTSDQKFNQGKNLQKVSPEKLSKWLETVNAHIATDPRHYEQPDQYGGTKAALEEMINNGVVSDETKKDLDDTYNISNSSLERILEAYRTLGGEDRSNTFHDDVLENIDAYDPTSYDINAESATKIENITSRILTTISNIGIVISVIMLAVLGVKYMLGSVEEKAEYKAGLFPYVIGAFILFGITGFVRILLAIGDKIQNI